MPWSRPWNYMSYLTIKVGCTKGIKNCLLARLFFKEKKSSYCHQSGVVVVVVVGSGVVVVVVVVTNFNLGYNFISVEANLIKLHMLIHHHKGYNLTKDYNTARLFVKIMPLYRYTKMVRVLIIGKSMAWQPC